MKITQLPSRGYPWLSCSQTFLVIFFFSLYVTCIIHVKEENDTNV